MRRVWILVGIGVAGLVALLVWLHGARPDALESQDSQIRFVYLVVLLVAVGASVLMHRRTRPATQWLRDVLIWITLGLVLVVGYSFRFEAMTAWNRLLAELMPGRGIEVAPGRIIVRAGEDSHFRLDATVDGTTLHMLVDTGATSVVLSPRDAARLGLAVDRLSYDRRAETANGIGLGAAIRLREIRVGPIVVRDVPALVNKAPMSSSLLGMSFLDRLSGFSIENGTLTLIR